MALVEILLFGLTVYDQVYLTMSFVDWTCSSLLNAAAALVRRAAGC